MSFEIPQNATAYEILDALDLWASTVRNAGPVVEVYWVLAALRGPDHIAGVDGVLLKAETTAVIRGAALPNMCRRAYALENHDPLGGQQIHIERLADDRTQHHFHEHVALAARVLLGHPRFEAGGTRLPAGPGGPAR